MSYRYVDENGMEHSLASAEELVAAINDQRVLAATLLRDEEGRWRRADQVLPSAFAAPAGDQKADPRSDKAPKPLLLVLVLVFGIGTLVADLDTPGVSDAGLLGYALGHTLIACLLGILITRLPRSVRRYWPLGALGVSVVIFATNARPDLEMREALENFEGVTEQIASDVRGDLGIPQVPPLSRSEFEAAQVRAATRFLSRLQEHGEQLARNLGVADEPDAAWLETPYYVTPTAYPQVRDYFQTYGRLVDRLALDGQNERFVMGLYREGLVAEGVSNPVQLETASAAFWEGYRGRFASQDTTFDLMRRYGEAALELHRELVALEGTFGTATDGSLEQIGSASIDAVIEAEDRVTRLAELVTLRMELQVQQLEGLADSLARSVR